MPDKWWRLKHDWEAEVWELGDTQDNFTEEQVFPYDGVILGADVLAPDYLSALARARELEDAWYKEA